mgnify:CR=1 FL=1
MISQISVYPKLLPSIAAVVIAPGRSQFPLRSTPVQFFLSDPLMEAVQHLPQTLLLNTSYVHPDTKARILAAVKELSYQPNVLAKDCVRANATPSGSSSPDYP